GIDESNSFYLDSEQIFWKGIFIQNSSNSSIYIDVDSLTISDFLDFIILIETSLVRLNITDFVISGQTGIDPVTSVMTFTSSTVNMTISNLEAQVVNKNIIQVIDGIEFVQDIASLNLIGAFTFYLTSNTAVDLNIQKIISDSELFNFTGAIHNIAIDSVILNNGRLARFIPGASGIMV